MRRAATAAGVVAAFLIAMVVIVSPASERQSHGSAPSRRFGSNARTTTSTTATPALADAELRRMVNWPDHVDFVDVEHAVGWSTSCVKKVSCHTVFAASGDGGAHWEFRSQIAKANGNSDPHLGIRGSTRAYFQSPSVGWFVGGELFFATKDGGRTWDQTYAPWIEALAPGDSAGLWALGSCGEVRQCVRAGRLSPGSAAVLPAAVPRAATVAAAATEGGVFESVLVTTATSGLMAFDLLGPCLGHRDDSQIVAIDARNLWWNCEGEPGGAQGSQRIYRSTDAGGRWVVVSDNGVLSEGPVGSLPTSPLGLSVSPAGILLGTANYGPLYRSADGGATWSSVADLVTSASVQWVDRETAFARSLQSLLVTHDAGLTWTLVATEPINR